VIEPRQNRERLRSDALDVVLIGRDLHERRANLVQLRRIAAAEAGQRRTAGLERTILIAPDLEESRRGIDNVTEESSEDRITLDPSVGTRSCAKEVVAASAAVTVPRFVTPASTAVRGAPTYVRSATTFLSARSITTLTGPPWHWSAVFVENDP
jgi:hypothetical protein